TFVVDAEIGVVVADALDGVTRNADIIDVGVGRDFAGQHYEAGVAQRFGGNAGTWILLEDGIEDGIRDLVGDFVGVAFRDGFGSKEIIVGHEGSSYCSKTAAATRACDALATFIFRFASCLLTRRILRKVVFYAPLRNFWRTDLLCPSTSINRMLVFLFRV